MIPDKDRALVPGLVRPFLVYMYLISELLMDKIGPIDIVSIPFFVVFFLSGA